MGSGRVCGAMIYTKEEKMSEKQQKMNKIRICKHRYEREWIQRCFMGGAGYNGFIVKP
jgi:hypothetical protein